MHLLNTEDDRIAFQMSASEKTLFLLALKQYPLVPSSAAKFAHSDEPVLVEGQLLLDQALAEHRESNQRQIQAFLDSNSYFEANSQGYRLMLTHAEREWLLQVFNDVRVGCWWMLGCPDPADTPSKTNNRSLDRYNLFMDLCAFFQSALLGGAPI